MVRDIYNIDEQFKRSYELCKKELPQYQYTVFFEYADYCLSKGFTKNRVIKILSFLRQSAHLAGQTLTALKEKELIELLSRINTLEISNATRNDYVIILRGYYKFSFRNQKKKYERIKDLLVKKSCTQVREPYETLQPDDIPLLINAVKSNEIKTIIALLWETGARIGEILNLRPKDVSYNQFGAILRLDGKTGLRYVQIVESAHQLKPYLTRKEYLFEQNYASFKKHLNGIKERLNMSELYPHLFRKSRATYLSNFMNEPQLKKYLGWTTGSRVLQHYIFLKCEDANTAYLRIFGGQQNKQTSLQEYRNGQLSLSRSLNISAASRKYNRSSTLVPFMPRSSAMSMRRFRSY